MSFSLIERKIHKYTHKLSRSSTRDKANFYQQKLRHYHSLKQSGGAAGDDILKDLVIIDEGVDGLKEAIRKKEEAIIGCEERIKEGVPDTAKLAELEEDKTNLLEKLEEKQTALEEKQTALEEKQTALNEKQTALDDLNKELETLTESKEALEKILASTRQLKTKISAEPAAPAGLQEGGCGGACGLPLLPMYS